MATLNPIQASYLYSMGLGHEFSLTFAPSNVRWVFKTLIDARVCEPFTRTFDHDPQIYDFIRITPYGAQTLKDWQ